MKITKIILEILYLGTLLYQWNNYLHPRGAGPELSNLTALITSNGLLFLSIVVLVINFFGIREPYFYLTIFIASIASLVHILFEMFYHKGEDRFDYLSLCTQITFFAILYIGFQLYKDFKSL